MRNDRQINKATAYNKFEVFLMNNESIELSKKLAAEQAVKENVKENMILGIGSGSTIVYVVKKIAELKINVHCIPTSYQSNQLILKNKPLHQILKNL
jgi:ribose 5-phosphate isomerase